MKINLFRTHSIYFAPDTGDVGAGAPAEPQSNQPSGQTGTQPSTPADDKKVGMPNPFEHKAPETPVQQQPAAQAVVPEKYEFNLPEGMSISDELKSRFTEVAKSAKLTQEQADSLLKMHADTMMEVNGQAEAMANTWAEESNKQGLLAPEKIGLANEALNLFGTKELKNLLVDSGVANHPEVLTFLQRIGGLIHEDTPVSGGNVASQPEVSYFPNSKY